MPIDINLWFPRVETKSIKFYFAFIEMIIIERLYNVFIMANWLCLLKSRFSNSCCMTSVITYPSYLVFKYKKKFFLGCMNLDVACEFKYVIGCAIKNVAMVIKNAWLIKFPTKISTKPIFSSDFLIGCQSSYRFSHYLLEWQNLEIFHFFLLPLSIK